MKILSKKLLITFFVLFFLSIANSYSQSEGDKINQLIEQKRNFNKKNKNSHVFKIQLYNGYENEAYKIMANFRLAFPEYKVEIKYKQPEWKTQVVYFKTRLEADRALNKIKEKFSGAIILEDKI
jgi:hypothetical protein